MSDIVDPPSTYKSSEVSIVGAAAVLLNGIVGAGIIAMPFAVKQCGFFSGLALIAVAAYTLMETGVLIISVGARENLVHFEDIAEKLFGPRGYYLAMYAMFAFALGDMLGYLVIIGDGLPLVYQRFSSENDAPSRGLTIFLVALFVILPMSLFKHMASLTTTALVSVISVIVLSFVIVIGGPKEAEKQGIRISESDYSVVKSSAFVGADVMAFVFVNHHGAALVFKTMKYPSISNWRRATLLTCRLAVVLTAMVSIAGCLSFGASTESNILKNFTNKDPVVDAARVMVSLSVILTYPQDCYVARHCALSIFRRLSSHRARVSEETLIPVAQFNPLHEQPFGVSMVQSAPAAALPWTDESSVVAFASPSEEDRSDASSAPHVVATLALWTTTLVVAVTVTDLGIVNALNGALAGSLLGFVLPAAMHLRSHQEDARATLRSITQTSKSIPEYLYLVATLLSTQLFCVFCIAAGLLCCVVGVLSVALKYSN